jgi:2'-phosphotransferase
MSVNNKDTEKNNKIKQSKYLSWALRHGLNELKLVPDSEGYVNLSDILNKSNGRSGTLDQVLNIVDTCNKNRFTIKKIGNNLFIRANQGHSKDIGDQIDSECLLNKITEPIPNVFHGTYIKFLEPISLTGLNRMSRKHIHFAKSLDAVSGKRSDCNLLVYVDMAKAMDDGIIFYESSNGVILTEGIDGILDPKYLSFNEIKN